MNLGVRYDYYEQGYPDIHLPATRYVAHGAQFPGGEARRLEGSVAAPRRRVRPVRQRQDGDQGEREPLQRTGAVPERSEPGPRQRHDAAHLDRSERRFHHPGRSVQPGDQRRARRRARTGTSAARSSRTTSIPTTRSASACGRINWEDVGVGPARADVRGVGQRRLPFPRWYGNFQVNDNTLVAPSDYSPYQVTAPNDSRLPNGGNYGITDLFDLNTNKVGQNQTITTSSSKYGEQYRALERRRPIRAGPSDGRCDPAGRGQHRQDHHRQLRCGTEGRQPELRASATTRRRTCRSTSSAAAIRSRWAFNSRARSRALPALPSRRTPRSPMRRSSRPSWTGAVAGHHGNDPAARAQHDVQRSRHATRPADCEDTSGSAPID